MIGKIKRASFLIITFITISLFSLFIIYSLQKAINLQLGQDGFLSKEAITFECENDSSAINTDLLNLKGNYILIKETSGFSDYKSIFIKGKCDNKPEMIEGRFFKEEDFNKDNKYTVIGKNLLENLVDEDGKKYYSIEGSYYEVIGVMGNSKEDTPYDNYVYVNLDSLLEKDGSYLNGKFIIDGRLNSNNLFEEITEKYKDTSMSVKKVNRTSSLTEDIIKDNIASKTKYIIEIVCVLVINTFLITEYWIKDRDKEMGIRRVVGATKMQISIRILRELMIIGLISYLTGYLLFLGVTYIMDGYLHFYIETMIYVLLIVMTSSLLASFVPIIKANKMEPSEVIK